MESAIPASKRTSSINGGPSCSIWYGPSRGPTATMDNLESVRNSSARRSSILPRGVLRQHRFHLKTQLLVGLGEQGRAIRRSELPRRVIEFLDLAPPFGVHRGTTLLNGSYTSDICFLRLFLSPGRRFTELESGRVSLNYI